MKYLSFPPLHTEPPDAIPPFCSLGWWCKEVQQDTMVLGVYLVVNFCGPKMESTVSCRCSPEVEL